MTTREKALEAAALTLDEKLVLLIEECGEVIQAATKCLRFGFDRDQPGYGLNSLVLSKEIGDFLGVVRALPLDQSAIDAARQSKMQRAQDAKASFGRPAAYEAALKGSEGA